MRCEIQGPAQCPLKYKALVSQLTRGAPAGKKNGAAAGRCKVLVPVRCAGCAHHHGRDRRDEGVTRIRGAWGGALGATFEPIWQGRAFDLGFGAFLQRTTESVLQDWRWAERKRLHMLSADSAVTAHFAAPCYTRCSERWTQCEVFCFWDRRCDTAVSGRVGSYDRHYGRAVAGGLAGPGGSGSLTE